jgi:flagellar biosynthesis/type III secretory pathway protein FliH
MQVGTEILLARMKEYPDEFFNGNLVGRWSGIIDDARMYLPKEDVEALDEGYRQLRVDRFNERVLARLAGEDKQEAEETVKVKASGRYSLGTTDPRVQYEQAMKQKQYEADQQRMMMNAAQQSQYASGLQNGAFNGFNDIFGGNK